MERSSHNLLRRLLLRFYKFGVGVTSALCHPRRPLRSTAIAGVCGRARLREAAHSNEESKADRFVAALPRLGHRSDAYDGGRRRHATLDGRMNQGRRKREIGGRGEPGPHPGDDGIDGEGRRGSTAAET